MRQIQTGLIVFFLIGGVLMMIGAGFAEQSQFSSLPPDELGKPQRTKALRGNQAIQAETPAATPSRPVPPTPTSTATDTPWADIPHTWHWRAVQVFSAMPCESHRVVHTKGENKNPSIDQRAWIALGRNRIKRLFELVQPANFFQLVSRKRVE